MKLSYTLPSTRVCQLVRRAIRLAACRTPRQGTLTVSNGSMLLPQPYFLPDASAVLAPQPPVLSCSAAVSVPGSTSADFVSPAWNTCARKRARPARTPSCRMQLQKGFSLIEMSIVTAIVLLLAIMAIPAVGNYVMENRVPKVGEALARFIVQTRIVGSGGASTPYAGINTGNLANMVANSGVFTVSGTGSTASVRHGLGIDGTATVSESSMGAGFTVTLSKVNNIACPGIASMMQRVSDTVKVAPESGTSTVVKSSSVAFNAMAAEAACEQGDVNTFTFTVG